MYRTTEQDHPKPSFYRILLAQPEMDSKLEKGRVVAERIQNGKRRLEPFNLSEEAQFPDFRLVAKEDEEHFCRWNEVEDFVHERDAEAKPKFIEMPPLLKLFVERNRKFHGESVSEEDMVLSAHKIYETEHRLEDRVEPNSMHNHIEGRFKDYEDFDVKRVPEDWNFEKLKVLVGHREYLERIEGSKDYNEFKARQE